MSYYLKWWLAPILSVGVLGGAGFYYFNYKSPAGDLSSAEIERNDYEELNDSRVQSEGLQSSPEEELQTNDESSETASADSQQKRDLASSTKTAELCIEMYGPRSLTPQQKKEVAMKGIYQQIKISRGEYRMQWSRAKECSEIPMRLVSRIYKVFQFLKSPNKNNLSKIDPESFDVYLNISINPFLYRLVRYWTRGETEEVLYWIINNGNALNRIVLEDHNYQMLTAMLRKFVNFNPKGDSIYRPFLSKVKKRKLMEVAIQSNNGEEAIEWFMDYINDTHSACRINEVSKACFKVYCKIGRNIDSRFMKKWMSFNGFQNYIEDIIDDKINSRQGSGSNKGIGWNYGDGNSQIDDIDDIEDDWTAQLCKGIS